FPDALELAREILREPSAKHPGALPAKRNFLIRPMLAQSSGAFEKALEGSAKVVARNSLEPIRNQIDPLGRGIEPGTRRARERAGREMDQPLAFATGKRRHLALHP